MDKSIKFLIDECLSSDLVGILKDEYGFLDSTHVTWIGKPPPGYKSWKDHSLVEEISSRDVVFVTNNRRDFVEKYYPSAINIHNGLVIILDIIDIDHEINIFRIVMNRIIQLDDIVNKLVEVDRMGQIKIVDWPNHDSPKPWADPFK